MDFTGGYNHADLKFIKTACVTDLDQRAAAPLSRLQLAAGRS